MEDRKIWKYIIIVRINVSGFDRPFIFKQACSNASFTAYTQIMIENKSVSHDS
jgi:hypothetical protein